MYLAYTCSVILIFALFPTDTESQLRVGLADVRFQRIEDCPNVDETREFTIRARERRRNRFTQFLNIDLDTEYDLDDSIVVDINTSIRRNGGYTSIYQLRVPFCVALQQPVDIFFVVLKASADVESCPIPAGSYSARNFNINSRRSTVRQLYGAYREEVNIYRDDVLLRCQVIYYELIPRAT